MIKFLFKLPMRLLIGGFLLLIIVAWGIGWGARALLNPSTEQSPTTTVKPSATIMVLPASTAQVLPVQSPVPSTSTSAPSPTPVPANLGEEIVQPGDGLYVVCRRHCPARWPPDDADLEAYAREVAELNGLSWPNPALSAGQSLRMPPCP